MYTLEPADKEIPTGRYRVVLSVSGRAQKGTLWTPDPQHRLPELLDVPGRTAIRIHAGNVASHSEGCILVGLQRGQDAVYQSRDALRALLPVLAEAGECWITVAQG